MSLPKTYKAVVVEKPHAPHTIVDVPMPTPAEDEILIKVKACGLCWSDVEVNQGLPGEGPFPLTPGHEAVGEVVQLGSKVGDRHAIGDIVGGAWHAFHDGTCVFCRGGNLNGCDSAGVHGISHKGGYAEYMIIKSFVAVKVPEGMDPAEAAPLLCAGLTMFNGIRNMGVKQGSLVAIQGVGGLGHLGVQFASKMGYEVAVLSHSDDKKDFAMSLGAHHFINVETQDPAAELAKLGYAAIIFQTQPVTNGQALAGGLGPFGKLVHVSPHGTTTFDNFPMLIKGRSAVGWAAGSPFDAEDTLRFAKLFGIKPLINKYPFSDVQKAFDDLVAGKPRFRNVLTME